MEFEIAYGWLNDGEEFVKSTKLIFIFNNSLEVEDLNIDVIRLESFSRYQIQSRHSNTFRGHSCGIFNL